MHKMSNGLCDADDHPFRMRRNLGASKSISVSFLRNSFLSNFKHGDCWRPFADSRPKLGPNWRSATEELPVGFSKGFLNHLVFWEMKNYWVLWTAWANCLRRMTKVRLQVVRNFWSPITWFIWLGNITGAFRTIFYVFSHFSAKKMPVFWWDT